MLNNFSFEKNCWTRDKLYDRELKLGLNYNLRWEGMREKNNLIFLLVSTCFTSSTAVSRKLRYVGDYLFRETRAHLSMKS